MTTKFDGLHLQEIAKQFENKKYSDLATYREQAIVKILIQAGLVKLSKNKVIELT